MPLLKVLAAIDKLPSGDAMLALTKLIDKKVIVSAFEDLPKRTGTIESIDDDTIGIMIDADDTADEHYAEIYEDNFKLIRIIPDV